MGRAILAQPGASAPALAAAARFNEAAADALTYAATRDDARLRAYDAEETQTRNLLKLISDDGEAAANQLEAVENQANAAFNGLDALVGDARRGGADPSLLKSRLAASGPAIDKATTAAEALDGLRFKRQTDAIERARRRDGIAAGLFLVAAGGSAGFAAAFNRRPETRDAPDLASLATGDAASRSEALARLGREVAHEHNNLITAVIGNLDLLTTRLAGDPESFRIAARAMNAARRGRVMAQRILAMAAGPNEKAAAGMGSIAAADEDPRAADPARGVILVVEDDPDVRDLACQTLNERGWKALEAGTAAQALDILRNDPNVDALFTDIALPGAASGYDLARAARAINPRLRVGYTSGYSATALDRYGEAAIAGPVLHKPYDTRELVRFVALALLPADPA